MMKPLFILISLMIMSHCLPGSAQEERYMAGVSYGFQYKITDIWVGDPYNIWIDQTSSSIVEGFIYRNLSNLFRIGLYCDYEWGKFDVIGLPEQTAERLGAGTLWLGHYPDTWIQFQLGGYVGFNRVFVDYEDVENRSGMDYGIVVGPAIEYGKFGIALHHHAGFAWYPKDADPDEFTYNNTKFKVKVYYTF